MDRDYNRLYTEHEIKNNFVRAIMYHNKIIYEFRQCLLCKRSIVDLKRKKIHWESIFTISMPQFTHHPSIEFFSICPQCRQRPIQDIFNYISIRRINDYRTTAKLQKKIKQKIGTTNV